MRDKIHFLGKFDDMMKDDLHNCFTVFYDGDDFCIYHLSLNGHASMKIEITLFNP